MLRAGYTTRMKTARYNFTAGVGVRERVWALDYALVPYGDFGLTHHLYLSFSFAGSTERGVKSRAAENPGSLQDSPGPQSGDFLLIPSEYEEKH
jgi:hypothetical protein